MIRKGVKGALSVVLRDKFTFYNTVCYNKLTAHHMLRNYKSIRIAWQVNGRMFALSRRLSPHDDSPFNAGNWWFDSRSTTFSKQPDNARFAIVICVSWVTATWSCDSGSIISITPSSWCDNFASDLPYATTHAFYIRTYLPCVCTGWGA